MSLLFRYKNLLETEVSIPMKAVVIIHHLGKITENEQTWDCENAVNLIMTWLTSAIRRLYDLLPAFGDVIDNLCGPGGYPVGSTVFDSGDNESLKQAAIGFLNQYVSSRTFEFSIVGHARTRITPQVA